MTLVAPARVAAQAAMKIFPMLTCDPLFSYFVWLGALIPSVGEPDASASRRYDKLTARQTAATASRITMSNLLDQFHLGACGCVMARIQPWQIARSHR